MSKTYRIQFHPGAVEDVLDVARHIRDDRQNPANADRFVGLVYAQAGRLDTFPGAYRDVSDAPPRPVHAVPVRSARSYSLYFEVFEDEALVRVLYVWDNRRGTQPNLGRRHDPLEP